MIDRPIKDGRFVGNRIVRYLLEQAKKGRRVDLDDLWELLQLEMCTQEELQEFYQLIGYSTSGYEEFFDKEENHG